MQHAFSRSHGGKYRKRNATPKRLWQRMVFEKKVNVTEAMTVRWD
jgi:hypothetical protein